MALIEAQRLRLSDQRLRPIVFALFSPLSDGVPVVVPMGVPGVGFLRPENLQVVRHARGAVFQTARGAFLDDFGEGVPTILISGHTGWNQTFTSGLVGFKALEVMFVEYLRRRERVASRGGDPASVQLWYLDTLNFEAFSVYPHEFVLERNKSQALLYFYRMRFSGLGDLLQEAVYDIGKSVVDFIAGPGSADTSVQWQQVADEAAAGGLSSAAIGSPDQATGPGIGPELEEVAP